MKKHIILKPLSEEKMRSRLLGDEERVNSIIRYFVGKIHDLDFYFDEHTKELSGRDGEYVANIFNNKSNIFWNIYNRIYEYVVWPPTLDLREGLLGALLRFAWNVDGKNMEWEPVIRQLDVKDEDGNVVGLIIG